MCFCIYLSQKTRTINHLSMTRTIKDDNNEEASAQIKKALDTFF